MYNWYLFITAVIQHIYGHKLRYILYIALPLIIPTSTYLAPSSCDRNRPPQSPVARKLSPLSPIAPLYPSPPQIPSLLGFPGPNVLLIRTHPNPFPQYTAQSPLGCVNYYPHNYMYLQIGALDDASWGIF